MLADGRSHGLPLGSRKSSTLKGIAPLQYQRCKHLDPEGVHEMVILSQVPVHMLEDTIYGIASPERTMSPAI